MGMTYLSVSGTVGAALGAREFTEYGYCVKASPSCEKSARFDGDPLLVRLEWRHKHRARGEWTAALTLGESPFDPVADVPVAALVRCEYEEGGSQSNGKVLRAIPGEWLLPFLHGRYDDASGDRHRDLRRPRGERVHRKGRGHYGRRERHRPRDRGALRARGRDDRARRRRAARARRGSRCAARFRRECLRRRTATSRSFESVQARRARSRRALRQSAPAVQQRRRRRA